MESKILKGLTRRYIQDLSLAYPDGNNAYSHIFMPGNYLAYTF